MIWHTTRLIPGSWRQNSLLTVNRADVGWAKVLKLFIFLIRRLPRFWKPYYIIPVIPEKSNGRKVHFDQAQYKIRFGNGVFWLLHWGLSLKIRFSFFIESHRKTPGYQKGFTFLKGETFYFVLKRFWLKTRFIYNGWTAPCGFDNKETLLFSHPVAGTFCGDKGYCSVDNLIVVFRHEGFCLP